MTDEESPVQSGIEGPSSASDVEPSEQVGASPVSSWTSSSTSAVIPSATPDIAAVQASSTPRVTRNSTSDAPSSSTLENTSCPPPGISEQTSTWLFFQASLLLLTALSLYERRVVNPSEDEHQSTANGSTIRFIKMLLLLSYTCFIGSAVVEVVLVDCRNHLSYRRVPHMIYGTEGHSFNVFLSSLTIGGSVWQLTGWMGLLTRIAKDNDGDAQKQNYQIDHGWSSPDMGIYSAFLMIGTSLWVASCILMAIISDGMNLRRYLCRRPQESTSQYSQHHLYAVGNTWYSIASIFLMYSVTFWPERSWREWSGAWYTRWIGLGALNAAAIAYLFADHRSWRLLCLPSGVTTV